jgi:hypothetical protein
MVVSSPSDSPNILARLGDLGLFCEAKLGAPNHVILNEVGCCPFLSMVKRLIPKLRKQYTPGQGIMVIFGPPHVQRWHSNFDCNDDHYKPVTAP